MCEGCTCTLCARHVSIMKTVPSEWQNETDVAVVQHNVESTCIYTFVQSLYKVTIQYLMRWKQVSGGMVCGEMVCGGMVCAGMA